MPRTAAERCDRVILAAMGGFLTPFFALHPVTKRALAAALA
jgi:hypothetical protein